MLLNQFSEEVLVLILEYLNIQDLLKLSRSSWLFRRLCFLPSLWKCKTVKVLPLVPSVKSNPLFNLSTIKYDLRELTDSDIRLVKQFDTKRSIKRYCTFSDEFCNACLSYRPISSAQCKRCYHRVCKCQIIEGFCKDCFYKHYNKCNSCNGNQQKYDGFNCLSCKRFFCSFCIIQTDYYGYLCEDCIDQCPICNNDVPETHLFPCSKCGEKICRHCILAFPKKIDICVKCG